MIFVGGARGLADVVVRWMSSASGIFCGRPSLCVSVACAARGGIEGGVTGVWSSWTLKKPEHCGRLSWCHAGVGRGCALFPPRVCSLVVVAGLMGFLASSSFCLRCEGTSLVGPAHVSLSARACLLTAGRKGYDDPRRRGRRTTDTRRPLVLVVSVRLCGPWVCGRCGVCQ